MFVEWIDAGSNQITSLQDKGTQDAHKRLQDCNIETGTGHEASMLENITMMMMMMMMMMMTMSIHS